MALATTLSKDEVQRTLKGQIKRPKKCIPPPKYLCTPSSLQIQQTVSTLDESHNVCDQLAKLLAIHGHIPELDTLSVASMKNIYYGQHDAKHISEVQKLPLIRRFVVRYLKNKFLEDTAHRQFW
ncbi:hypothetical protein FBUS_10190 [Fasciolopsis buskii]|uniref:Uncharacterized protein n=1 Tax=Fasciolopsis buskii TaxID=27845 RepID=A0A8E0VMW5_9TREM|nr:hypothetical protein FBUS_10190 [Fasciolopsis buski]